MDFPMGFWVVLNLLHQFVVKIITNFKFDKRCFNQRLPLEAYLYHRRGVLRTNEIHRLGPKDLKI
jgi:hypothetical protein